MLVAEADVTDADTIRTLATRASERFAPIDVQVNRVGISAIGRFDTPPIEVHRRVANLLGPMNAAHAALAHFRARGHGTLVDMISVAGSTSAPSAAADTASKLALREMSESLRAEAPKLLNVQVRAVRDVGR